MHSELTTGTYQHNDNRTWEEFWSEYKDKAMPSEPRSREACANSISHFVRIAKPTQVSKITTMTIDNFIAKRRKERGLKKGDTLSPASVNKDLRYIKQVLIKAMKWKYLRELPDVAFVREPKKDPTYIPPDHFGAIYGACHAAKRPKFWQALLATCYMTGWRIGETLKWRRDDLDLDAGIARFRAGDTKGKRAETIRLHPVIVDHLKKIRCFEERVFPWMLSKRQLYVEFHRIQKAAGIHLPCDEDHEHTPACHFYGFHDERRAFATMNKQLAGVELQKLMRHRDYSTTLRYINMSDQLDTAVESLHVPQVLRASGGGI